ncbi:MULTISPECIES: endopeptidase La [unclassified Candidatus Frackibacter]|uniref:endopeptidase La n=1 Tax=unclassified Candidatus Frackibacter TaxID=2648818 RepID=UPI00087FAFBC|nr:MULTISPECIES: endopeptidase La [unclassified Candidatus Frackibacter]SDC75958.1 ATP-dependent proteinase. Serine peptidase. MEROPS family S16 [Candidatus Frackibacter sp. WG11]SFL98978.1 ATP-dependent proteinase. Serine peptidase. MEROPS family S16 [Candidatus Frackibacter sp. WG13]
MVEEIKEVNIGDELPLLVLRGLVVFPHMVIPLLVGRDKSIEALEEAMVEDRLILLAAQKDETVEEPEVDEIYNMGTIAEVKQLVKLPDGTIKILVEGLARAKIDEFLQEDPHFKVKIKEIEAEEEKTDEIEALMRSLINLFEDYVKLNKKLPPETMMTIVNVEDPGRLVDIMVSHMSLKVKQEQQILEALSYEDRLEELYKVLSKEIEVLKTEEKISSRVRSQVEKRQKEYYLKEQLKAIKKELGEDSDISNEIEEYKEKIKEAELPEEVEKKALKEAERLAKMPPMASEGVVVRNYLDCILDLPWNNKSEDRLVLDEADEVLERDHYGLEDVKDRILEYLAVRKLTSEMKSPILCLVGPPGVGKTSLGKSIAEAIEREFVRLSLGGVRDEAEIRGHRRTYVGSRPGRIINALRDAGTKNPLFLLDEVDKISSDFRGDPASALLEVLDPEQNDEFTDHYLEVPFDLSDIIFITTANVSHTIPRPLLDRMETIEVAGYTEDEKVKIAERHLLPKQIENHGLTEEQINISENAIKKVIRNYTREAGVRNLERKLANICRKVAKEVVKGKETLSRVTVQNVDKYLGIEKFNYGEASERPQVGVATGLAWTKTGGDILKIEVSVVPGKGKLFLTGKLGDVMKESAQAALSYARSKVEELDLEEDFHEKYDIHVHVPKGAIPKDGPSAGITIATAIISALSGKKVNEKIAMTGEITLRGRVLPVGGIKSKVLAAHRAGIEKVILCDENEKNLEDIPKEISKDLEFQIVEHMDEVIAAALLEEE